MAKGPEGLRAPQRANLSSSQTTGSPSERVIPNTTCRTPRRVAYSKGHVDKPGMRAHSYSARAAVMQRQVAVAGAHCIAPSAKSGSCRVWERPCFKA